MILIVMYLTSSVSKTSRLFNSVCALQLDLFPDVQEAYVAELILKNNVKDLNV